MTEEESDKKPDLVSWEWIKSASAIIVFGFIVWLFLGSGAVIRMMKDMASGAITIVIGMAALVAAFFAVEKLFGYLGKKFGITSTGVILTYIGIATLTAFGFFVIGIAEFVTGLFH